MLNIENDEPDHTNIKSSFISTSIPGAGSREVRIINAMTATSVRGVPREIGINRWATIFTCGREPPLWGLPRNKRLDVQLGETPGPLMISGNNISPLRQNCT